MSDIPPLKFETPLLEIEGKIEELKRMEELTGQSYRNAINKLQKKLDKAKSDIYGRLTPAEKVQVARCAGRPYTLDYIKYIFTDFFEMHGDRAFGDDQAIIGGIAKLDGEPVMVIGHQKGRNTKENIARNFGMAHPEGYRKAVRLFKTANTFNRPIITFVDTPGAYPGIGAEERGQAEAIAEALFEMARLKVPLITFIIGEGGSGGALGIAMGNRVIMLEHSIYSVISPEGCASILWSDPSFADRAAEALKITAVDLLKFGVIDEILSEPLGGAHRDHKTIAERVYLSLVKHLSELKKLSGEQLVEDRYKKYRAMGVFSDRSA